jgi:hypothetical protein
MSGQLSNEGSQDIFAGSGAFSSFRVWPSEERSAPMETKPRGQKRSVRPIWRAFETGLIAFS